MIEKVTQEDFGQWKCIFKFESQKGIKSVTKTSILSELADKGVAAREVEFKPNVEFIKMKMSQNRQANKMPGEVKDILGMMNVKEELPSVGLVTEKTVNVVPIGNGIMRKTMRIVSKRMMKNGVIKTKTMSQRHEDYRSDSALDYDTLDSNEFDEEVGMLGGLSGCCLRDGVCDGRIFPSLGYSIRRY